MQRQYADRRESRPNYQEKTARPGQPIRWRSQPPRASHGRSRSIKHKACAMVVPIAVFFGCPGCSAVYQALQHTSQNSETDSFSCRNCGAVVHSWRERTSYGDWRLFEPESGRVAGRKHKELAGSADSSGSHRTEQRPRRKLPSTRSSR